MQETINLTCKTCGINYTKPKSYQEQVRPSCVFYKWSLEYCDECRRKKQDKAFDKLPEVLKALADSN